MSTNSNHSGFTLIEILVVMALMVLISFFAMPRVSSYFQLSLNSATRDLAMTIKEAYNSSVVTGHVHRIVYDLKHDSYWVEMGPTTVLLDTEESRKKEEERKRFASPDKKPPPSQFAMDTSVTRKKVSLPRGVRFEDLVTEQSKDPITAGMAYTHFFPHGVTEQTIIHLTDQSKHFATLVITPLLGLTDLYNRHMDAKEIFHK